MKLTNATTELLRSLDSRPDSDLLSVELSRRDELLHRLMVDNPAVEYPLAHDSLQLKIEC